ncbi:MAG TPA: hypothetical protein VND93_14490 [Myxococcales bacterium]|jgi:hypothetical protein|nr:hypothetical protein [Myxococcales bacterium]
MADRDFLIDLPLRERWQLVDVLRTAVFQSLAVVFEAETFAELVSMVVGELVENALKYGAWSPDAEPRSAEARLQISSRPNAVEVQVTNPLPEGASTDLLFSMLERIKKAASPQDAYVERLREVARDPNAAGGLGLMRIAYEANCAITAKVEGPLLRVRAQMDAPGEGALGYTHH